MADLDTERLVKLLGMTGSQHDGEALNALRMAQKLLAGAAKTGGDLIGGGASGGGNDRAFRNAMGLVERLNRELVEAREENHNLRTRCERLSGELAVIRRAQGEQATAAEFRSRPSVQGCNVSDQDLHRICCEVLEQHPEWLTEWEQGFMRDWVGKSPHWGVRRGFTDKQRAVFERIWAKADARVKGYG